MTCPWSLLIINPETTHRTVAEFLRDCDCSKRIFNLETAMKRQFLIFSSLLCVLLSANLSAKIYKWVDENGKVHYSDKPFNKDEKELNIKSKVSPEQSARARTEAQARIQKLRRQVESTISEQNAQKESAAKSAQEQKKLEQNCSVVKKQLALLNQQVRIVETDEKGEAKFLSDEERKKQINELNALLKQHCSGV